MVIKSQTGRSFVSLCALDGDKTQAQMASLWGEGVSQQNVSDAMRHIGVSRKKRHMGIESEMNSSAKSFKNA